ncbi:MAG: DNA-3-methyladenine glycosylase 2 family protein [Chlorobiaceae bacterium]|nr:DNA-3-methyladenine glycosylase 2 family protein [Chlorobiaceae bacterium]
MNTNGKTISVSDTVFSGQSFLWNKLKGNDDYYASVLGNTPVIIRQISEHVLEVISIGNTIDGLDIPDYIARYFTLDVRLDDSFPCDFSEFHPEVWRLIQPYLSTRIMRQEPFPTMITFMCAQGIGMQMIRRQVELLAATYGEKTDAAFSGQEISIYRFPDPIALARADPEELRFCTNNNRLRATNIVLASRAVAEGVIDLAGLTDRTIPLAVVRESLCGIKGIGYKIADCIALFGLGRFDAFPVDTHVRQYLAAWFHLPEAFRELSPHNYLLLQQQAQRIFNPDLAGYAGHILFHCWRKAVRGMNRF